MCSFNQPPFSLLRMSNADGDSVLTSQDYSFVIGSLAALPKHFGSRCDYIHGFAFDSWKAIHHGGNQTWNPDSWRSFVCL